MAENILSSFKSKAAIAYESSYGVENTTQAEYKTIRLVNENVIQTPNYIRSRAKFGVNGLLASFQESMKYAGTILVEFDYYDSLPILRLICGASSAEVEISEDDPVVGYTTYIVEPSEWHESSFDFLVDKGGEGLTKFIGGKVISTTIVSVSGSVVTAELECVFQTTGTVGALVVDDLVEREFVTLGDLMFRVEAGEEQILVNADEYKVSNFTFNLVWNMLSDALVSGGNILQPVPSAAREVTVNIENPEYDSLDTQLLVLRNAKNNDTPVSCDAEFRSNGATTPRSQFFIGFPRSKVVEGFEPETGDEIIPAAGVVQPYRQPAEGSPGYYGKEFYFKYVVRTV